MSQNAFSVTTGHQLLYSFPYTLQTFLLLFLLLSNIFISKKHIFAIILFQLQKKSNVHLQMKGFFFFLLAFWLVALKITANGEINNLLLLCIEKCSFLEVT